MSELPALYLLETNILVHLVRGDAVWARVRATYEPLLIEPRPITISVNMINTDWGRRNPAVARNFYLAALRGARDYCQAYHGGAVRKDMIDLLVRAVSILGRAAPRACCEPPRPRAVASHRPMAYGRHSWPTPSCCDTTTAASPL